MVTQIKTLEDVALFAKQIVSEGVSFHPDDDFFDYVVFGSDKPHYTEEQAEFRNLQMEKCFEICEKEEADIYDIMLEVMLTETGWDKYIPLPSTVLNDE